MVTLQHLSVRSNDQTEFDRLMAWKYQKFLKAEHLLVATVLTLGSQQSTGKCHLRQQLYGP